LLARSLNQKTALGAYLDPIADKLAAFLFVRCAGAEPERSAGGWPRWCSAATSFSDSAAVILVVVGYRPFPPSIYGKATTALQILLVFAVVLLAVTDWGWLQLLRNIIGYLVAGFTVFSGFHYCFTVARREDVQQPQ
jgi:cardiolipin synthase